MQKGMATRLRLLGAAEEELVAGHGDFELSAVARKAGVSQGLPYRYFDSKAAMVAAVVDGFFDRFDRAVFKPKLEDEGDWATRERLRTARFVEFFYADRIAPFVLSLLAGHREVIAAQQRRIAEQITAAEKNIQRGQKEGAIPRSLDASLHAALVMGGFYQALLKAMSQRPIPTQKHVTNTLHVFLSRVLQLGQNEVSCAGQ